MKIKRYYPIYLLCLIVLFCGGGCVDSSAKQNEEDQITIEQMVGYAEDKYGLDLIPLDFHKEGSSINPQANEYKENTLEVQNANKPSELFVVYESLSAPGDYYDNYQIVATSTEVTELLHASLSKTPTDLLLRGTLYSNLQLDDKSQSLKTVKEVLATEKNELVVRIRLIKGSVDPGELTLALEEVVKKINDLNPKEYYISCILTDGSASFDRFILNEAAYSKYRWEDFKGTLYNEMILNHLDNQVTSERISDFLQGGE